MKIRPSWIGKAWSHTFKEMHSFPLPLNKLGNDSEGCATAVQRKGLLPLAALIQITSRETSQEMFFFSFSCRHLLHVLLYTSTKTKIDANHLTNQTIWKALILVGRIIS